MADQLWPPETIAGQKPVVESTLDAALLERFTHVLAEAEDEDERPLQAFFEENPVVLLAGLTRPHRVWVFPRPSLPKPGSGGWVPDFLVCDWTSLGAEWTIVELESPRKSPLNKDGGVAAICSHAVQQVNDYRTYLLENAEFMRSHGWCGIRGDCDGVVIIGRAEHRNSEEGVKRLVAFRVQRVEIASYDRILLEATERQEYLVARRERIAKSIASRAMTIDPEFDDNN